MSNLQIPAWADKLFTEDWRYLTVRGGRGSGKSYMLALLVLYLGLKERHFVLCLREYQKSLDDSVLPLMKYWIDKHPALDAHYQINPQNIKGRNGTRIIFRGAAQETGGARGIRSIFGVTLTFADEAQYLTKASWREILPSVMREGNPRFMAAYNPLNPDDPVHTFAEDERDNALVLDVNWNDNPFFPESLDEMRRVDERLLSAAEYEHLWEGKLLPGDLVVDPVLPKEWLQACIDAYRPEYEAVHELHAGFDPADEGRDLNALALRRGPTLVDVSSWSGKGIDPGISAEKVHNICLDRGVEMLSFDATSVGAAVRSRLVQLDPSYRWKPVHYAGGVRNKKRWYVVGAMRNGAYFANRPAQLAWNLRQRAMMTMRLVAGGNVDPETCLFIAPEVAENEAFLAHMSQPTYDKDSGKVRVDKYGESRDNKQAKRSPDLFDAVTLAFGEDSAYGLTAPEERDDDEAQTT